MKVTISTNSRIVKFVKDHKKELIIGGIIVAGGVIIVTRAHKAGFLKGMARCTYADGASCDFTVSPMMWENSDGSKMLTAVLRHTGPSEAGTIISSKVALDKASATRIVNEIMEIFKEA